MARFILTIKKGENIDENIVLDGLPKMKILNTIKEKVSENLGIYAQFLLVMDIRDYLYNTASVKGFASRTWDGCEFALKCETNNESVSLVTNGHEPFYRPKDKYYIEISREDAERYFNILMRTIYVGTNVHDAKDYNKLASKQQSVEECINDFDTYGRFYNVPLKFYINSRTLKYDMGKVIENFGYSK